MRKDDPVPLTGYARQRKPLEQQGWKWAKIIAKNENKFLWMLKSMKGTKKKSETTKFKFGVQMPRTCDTVGAMKLDKENGNNLWFKAQQLEATTVKKLVVFKIMPKNFDLEGYQHVPLIYTFDAKFDGRRRARLVGNGKRTIGPLASEIW
mmetsp:Transcript_38133/g.53719  ORF Transcript_38133/g.53719 Transcript_38133/m.53719 type:complete len:150 (-) Transcript_38133:355-804(-)|eukprot:CAMPEP_0202478380 /NCGR_PEP_ID=MMETSP1360-20130828/94429_1 /ASSEMBLY_ACC=CAM_ASM_000848 /TAXON_ID=515479 /ORGANISM="Licmophora paradoxa, Strain CCMP2313" /LENGTH=149 /DNA_ID=CAMNT_0049105659 /DNA_START=1256 /DNA_END=1705 /DNA_ORIENTATION=-